MRKKLKEENILLLDGELLGCWECSIQHKKIKERTLKQWKEDLCPFVIFSIVIMKDKAVKKQINSCWKSCTSLCDEKTQQRTNPA